MEEMRTKRGMTEGCNFPVRIFPTIHILSEQQRVDPFRILWYWCMTQHLSIWTLLLPEGLKLPSRIGTIPLTVFLRNRCSETPSLCEVTLKVFFLTVREKGLNGI